MLVLDVFYLVENDFFVFVIVLQGLGNKSTM